MGYTARAEGAGSGSGLRIHTALLAAIGAALELTPRPSGGVCACIII
jgi:hypothetical protein